MSEDDEQTMGTKEMLNKISRYNKNVKALMDLMTKAVEKLDTLLKNKPSNDTADDADAEKEKMDKIFQKKKLGRPSGSFETKQKQYLNMLNEGKIAEPKPSTLEFYRIEKEGEVFKLMGE